MNLGYWTNILTCKGIDDDAVGGSISDEPLTRWGLKSPANSESPLKWTGRLVLSPLEWT